ncbi:hypothetical protein HanIR_Chr15g0772481 [Helianthus annuus]|nr:hypothetical protein HanIR_Chr15g0772481 [Helianthus annuus]
MHPKHIHQKHHLHAVWFAAGTALLLACVERAVVVSIFQYHMWVFLALNLLLIAILFTSTHPPHKSQETLSTQPPAEADHRDAAVDDGVSVFNENVGEAEGERHKGGVEDEEDDGDAKLSGLLLSNDELNERAEAFISRFRQQYLVSDVKISRSGSGSVCERVVLSKSVTV